jgi:hypothetical protein
MARAIARVLIAVVCLGATALGLINTYGDNGGVVALAEQTACGKPGCSYQKLREERSPLAQSFGFQISLTERGRQRSATADVECRREYVLAGEYRCQLTSGGLPSNPAE